MMKKASWPGLAASVLAVMALAVTSASAQITTGSVTGSVQDAQGLRVPGATVVLISESRQTRSAPAFTNSNGEFTIAGVLPDTYTVQITMPGFRTVTRAGVSISGGDRVAVGSLTIQPGGATETIEVSADAPLIQAQSGERSFAVLSESVEELPLVSRNWATLATLAPGMSNGQGFGGPSIERLGGGGQNNLMIDGISSMDTGNNGQMLQMNVDAIAEVKVLSSGYQAEFGRSSGLQISAVTKTGTNQFHGSAYGLMRDSDWNTNSWENQQNGVDKTDSSESDWGFTLGGPVGRPGGDNKLFFFYSMEFRPRSGGGNLQRYRLPTALEKAGNFSQSLDNNGAPIDPIIDYVTGQPFPGNIIPANRIYGPGQAVLNWWPIEPNLQQTPGNSYNFEQRLPTYSELQYQPAFTVDYQRTSNLRFSFRYTGHNQQAINVVRPGSIPGWNDTYRYHGRPWRVTYSGSVNYTFNPTTFLEATYGVAQNTLGNPPANPGANRITSGLGDLPLIFPDAGVVDPRYYNYKAIQDKDLPIFQDGRIVVAPDFSWGNQIGSAPPDNLYPGFLNINRTQDINISLTRVQGRHTFKGGFYLNHSYKAQNLSAGGGTRFEGQLDFGNDSNNPFDTGFGFANAMIGAYSEYSQQSRFIEGSYLYNNIEFFVQDNWKVNNQLTLDYGVRFVHQQPQYDQYDQTSNFFPDLWTRASAPQLYQPGCSSGVYPCGNADRALNPVTGQLLPAGSRSVIGQAVPNSGDPLNGIVPVGQSPNNKYNYEWPVLKAAPRFGAAYDVTGTQSFVIRGGAGLFFDRPNGNTVFAQAGNPPSSTSTTYNYGLLQNLSQGGLFSSDAVPSLVLYEFDNGSELPASWQWNAGVQMALPYSTSLDLSYVGQHSYNRHGGGVDLNAVDFGTAYLPAYQDPSQNQSGVPGADALSTNLLRPFRGLGELDQETQRHWRTYHSLQMSTQRRFRGGVAGGFNYTLSLSDRSNEGTDLRLQHAADGSISVRSDQAQYEDLMANAGLIRHVLKANFVWELPGLTYSDNMGKNVIAAIINDWQLSGIWTAGTGSPITPTFSYQRNGSSVNLTGSPSYGARIVLNGDPGSGCSGDQYRMYNTAVFAGPTYNSLGLESGRNYMNECFINIWDMAVTRNFRLGGGRSIMFRAEFFNAFNTVVFDDFQDTLQLVSPTDQTIRNNQFMPDGSVNPNRLRPQQAGFGAVQGARDLRTVQLQIRYRF